jgi:hypothetical protein
MPVARVTSGPASPHLNGKKTSLSYLSRQPYVLYLKFFNVHFNILLLHIFLSVIISQGCVGAMAGGRFTPVIIGVGDIKNKSTKIEDAIEPFQLMLKATVVALKDTELSPSALKKLQSSIDSVSVVNTWTWNYHDLPGLIGEKLGVKPSYKVLSHHGGDSPAKLLDEAARRISFGGAKVAVVTGGEALASRMS